MSWHVPHQHHSRVLSEEEQRAFVEEATKAVGDALGSMPTSFRAPSFRITGAALETLARLGYLVDSSVNAGRLAVTSSYKRENGMFWAPRRPYRPARDNAFQKGVLPIWEVPVSAGFLPLTVSALVALGRPAASLFVNTLIADARLRGRPIVYCAHPEEFDRDGPKRFAKPFRWSQFAWTEFGWPIRHRLLSKQASVYHATNERMLDRLRGIRGGEFLRMSEFAARLR